MDPTHPSKPHGYITPEESYEDILETTLYQQTCINIENMIHSNTLTMQHLKRNNEQLQLHLDNVKKILSPSYKVNPQNSYPKIRTQLVEKYKNQYPLDVYPDFEFTEENSPRSISDIQQFNGEQHLKKEKSGKGLMIQRYSKQEWVKEQYLIQKFINTCVNDNIELTPNEIHNFVSKSELLSLYLRWREETNIQGISIAQNRVQSILTNEMKQLYGCVCNSRIYVGMMIRWEKVSQKIEEERRIQQKWRGIERMIKEGSERKVDVQGWMDGRDKDMMEKNKMCGNGMNKQEKFDVIQSHWVQFNSVELSHKVESHQIDDEINNEQFSFGQQQEEEQERQEYTYEMIDIQ